MTPEEKRRIMEDRLYRRFSDYDDQISLLIEEYPKLARYITHDHTYQQAQVIQEGLKWGFDVTKYNDPRYSLDQMNAILAGLADGIDITEWVTPDTRVGVMNQIIRAHKNGLSENDISIIADPKYDSNQAREIRLGLEHGVDISEYASPKTTWQNMARARIALERGESIQASIDISNEYIAKVQASAYTRVGGTHMDVSAMARIEQVGQIFYYVASRDEHDPPHFHFEKPQDNSKSYGRILFESAEYYKSDKYPAELTRKEKESMLGMLKSKHPRDRYGRTYWEIAIDFWNQLPNVSEIDSKKNNTPPDYNDL